MVALAQAGKTPNAMLYKEIIEYHKAYVEGENNNKVWRGIDKVC